MRIRILLPTVFLLMCLLAGGMAEPLPTLVPVALSAPAPLELTEDQKYPANPQGYAVDGFGYHDDSLDIVVHHCRAYDTPICVAFVQIADPSQLRTKQSRPFPSKTSVHIGAIAKSVRAILAINADWFVYHNAGIIYRQGTLLRDHPRTDFDGLAIDANGDFHLIAPLTREGFEAIEQPIINSFCFGPALVIDGEVQTFGDRQVTYRQRTAIGQIAPLTYVLVCADGPEERDSVGLNMPQLAQLLKDLGAVNAYNMDGGGSSAMLLDGVKMNGQKALRLRDVGDILYFATAISAV